MEMRESNTVKVFGLMWLMACSLLFTACSQEHQQVPFYFTPDLSPTWTEPERSKTIHVIAPFEFTNQDGQPYGSNQLKGKVYVANFFFTSCPSICPRMTKNLTAVANAFSSDDTVNLISLSVTPDIDSVSRLKQFHEEYNLTSNWYLLTGNQKDIYQISRNSFFVEEEIGLSRDSSDFLHTERCMLVDYAGRLRGFYNATLALDMERLIDDIEIVRKEM